MKKKMIALAALLLAVVVTGYSVSGTYAKYTSTFTSNAATATVAKWKFKLGGAELKKESNFDFNLFETIYDEKGDVDAVDNDVKTKLIAPGTKGSFNIKLTNESEVRAHYTVVLDTKQLQNVPLEFSLDGKTGWKANASEVTISEGDLDMEAEGNSKDITIYWRWSFEADGRTEPYNSTSDDTDTNLGAGEEAVSPSVTAKITVTQID